MSSWQWHKASVGNGVGECVHLQPLLYWKMLQNVSICSLYCTGGRCFRMCPSAASTVLVEDASECVHLQPLLYWWKMLQNVSICSLYCTGGRCFRMSPSAASTVLVEDASECLHLQPLLYWKMLQNVSICSLYCTGGICFSPSHRSIPPPAAEPTLTIDINIGRDSITP